MRTRGGGTVSNPSNGSQIGGGRSSTPADEPMRRLQRGKDGHDELRPIRHVLSVEEMQSAQAAAGDRWTDISWRWEWDGKAEVAVTPIGSRYPDDQEQDPSSEDAQTRVEFSASTQRIVDGLRLAAQPLVDAVRERIAASAAVHPNNMCAIQSLVLVRDSSTHAVSWTRAGSSDAVSN